MQLQSDSIGALAGALAKAQSTIKTAVKDKTVKVATKTGGSYSYSYANLDSVMESCRKSLTDNELAVVQAPTVLEGKAFLVTTLMHSSGEWVRALYPLPQTTDPQAFGSGLTYARRYSISSLVGIVADEDDDGQAASRAPQQQQKPAPAKPPQQTKAPAKQEGTLPPERAEKLLDTMKESFGYTPNRALQFAAFITGREIKSFNDLTVDEAARVYRDAKDIHAKDQAKKNRVAPIGEDEGLESIPN